ncbi:glycoside hydrolase family 43 protein [Durotheca rogersii]|uniref:glycoside hydrolase family 43 protein n=1 Tax=Durotheca rogersii TaxID=419775 RepID=UPI00221FA9B0|nr:glycoside hydrolase family 43 protein [Durotheca rogersii]KAI5864779.1 glycoside hydrolase family 43 protein [Durotheca rogersii]
MPYDDSILTLTSVGTPDPFVIQFGGQYYFTFTAGNRVEIWSSPSLVDIEASSSRHVIWNPPQGTDHSADLWAPELHPIRGRWYVYYAAAHPAHGNKSHRMYVLGGPPTTRNPCEGEWEFLGRIRGMLPDQWAIDGTVFELEDGQLYLAYSGWPLENHYGHVDVVGEPSDLVQEIFIVKLEDPITVASSPVAISRPQHAWELSRDGNSIDHRINEGPQFLRAPDGHWRGLVYSCAGSWTHEYKMATLQLIEGGDPLNPASWHKGKGPLIQTREYTDQVDGGGDNGGRGIGGPFGPGHGCFVHVEDQVVAVYHATDTPTDGWQNRRARAQRLVFTNDGPYMGVPPGLAAQALLGRRQEKGGILSKLKQRLLRKLRNVEEEVVTGEESLRKLLGECKAP